MPTVLEIRKLVDRFASGELDLDTFQNRFAEISVGKFQAVDSERLSNKIEGLLAESSHAKWLEDDLRAELANAVRPFAGSDVRFRAG